MNFFKFVSETLSGGISFNPTFGTVPERGFMVSLPNQEQKIKLNTFCINDVRLYFLDNLEFFESKDYFLGSWLHEDNVYLDISINVETLDIALNIAKQNNQLVIYDVSNRACIMVE